MPKRPKAVSRLARVALSLIPCLRRCSLAASLSPLCSVRAFLQSIMGRPVSSRSCITAAAVISAISYLLKLKSKVACKMGERVRGFAGCRMGLADPSSLHSGRVRRPILRIRGKSHLPRLRRLGRGRCVAIGAGRLRLVFAAGGGGALAADEDRLGQVPGDQLDAPNAVVVAGDRQIDEVGIAVGID